MKIRTRLKRHFRRFNRRVASLDVRKLFALTLILVALDTGTALLHHILSPVTFARFESNSLFQWALITGHVEGYLVAEAIKVMAAVTVFALASWFAVFRASMLAFVMVTLLAISTNLTAIVVYPASVSFIAVQLLAFWLICAALGKSLARGWLKK